ncbi:MAG: hypothetical protein AAFV98_07150 [Chloroflexota bacterium]
MKGYVRQIVVLIAIVAMIYLNLTSNGSGFTEPSQVETTQSYYLYPTDFSPAPLTFLIWAPIFLGMLGLAVYQALPRNRQDKRFDKIALPIIIVSILNAVVNYVPITLSVIVVSFLLASLAWAFVTIVQLPSDRLFYSFVRVPVGIFFGWITIATILNVCQWLVSVGWDGGIVSSAIWVAILVIIASGIGSFVITRYREIAFGVVLIWGFLGILLSDLSQISVLIAVVVCSLLLCLLIAQVVKDNNMTQETFNPA